MLIIVCKFPSVLKFRCDSLMFETGLLYMAGNLQLELREDSSAGSRKVLQEFANVYRGMH